MKRIMKTTKEWLAKYEAVKDLLVSPVNFSELYKSKEALGKRLFILNMGKIRITNDEILVRDPLVWLKRYAEPYFTKVPVGEYELETLVAEIEEGHYRYIATRVRFNDKDSVVYHQALEGDENLDDVEDDSIFGFNVDAGLATIVDTNTRDAYCDFEERWYKENPEKNIYDDFFAEEFKKSYLEKPDFQRDGGDWINFNIPNTEYSIPMIQSGFGDGQYPVYFGYDEDGNLCDLVVEYITVDDSLADDDVEDEYPEFTEISSNVFWSFSQKNYDDAKVFAKDLKEYNDDMDNEITEAELDEIVLEETELIISYEAWISDVSEVKENEVLDMEEDEELLEEDKEDGMWQVEILAHVKSDSKDGFTMREILQKAHNQMANKELGDHVFFEGFEFMGRESDAYGLIDGEEELPVFFVICGS